MMFGGKGFTARQRSWARMSDGFKKLGSEFKPKAGRGVRPASVQPDGSVSGGR
jgi:hypothetical protein